MVEYLQDYADEIWTKKRKRGKRKPSQKSAAKNLSSSEKDAKQEKPSTPKIPTSRPAHRPRHYDPVADAKIVNDWQATRRFPDRTTAAEFETDRDMKPEDLERIIARHRQRERQEQRGELSSHQKYPSTSQLIRPPK